MVLKINSQAINFNFITLGVCFLTVGFAHHCVIYVYVLVIKYLMCLAGGRHN